MMRLVKLTNRWYGMEIDSIPDDLENIETFVNEGIPVLIVGAKEDMERLGVAAHEIEYVEKED